MVTSKAAAAVRLMGGTVGDGDAFSGRDGLMVEHIVFSQPKAGFLTTGGWFTVQSRLIIVQILSTHTFFLTVVNAHLIHKDTILAPCS